MFKSWRSEKKKIKAVFKLQFQATQVPQLKKKPALLISLVPEDVGKPTFKSEKAAVQDGTCSWENPIYVTVKLIKEQKTGKLHEKIFHFIVSTGSSKSGYLGEASIDFADFAEETEPLTVSLPLKFANSGAVLHVTIQKMQGGADHRYIEDNGDLMLSQDGNLKNQLSNGSAEGNNNNYAENAEQDDSFTGSIGSDASILLGHRQNSMHHKETNDTVMTKNHMHRRSSTDWSVGSASDGSLADSTNSPEDKLPRELKEASDESIEKLKSEITSLMRQSELSELKLQSLQKQITKESRRAQDLSTQVIDLKQERDVLKTECEKLKSSWKYIDGEETLKRLQAENGDSRVKLEEIRLELCDEKELNTNLQLQLQKTQDSNSELILAVQDLEDMLEKKNMEMSSLSSRLEITKSVDEVQGKKCKCNMKQDDKHQALPALEELAREKSDASELHQLKQKIRDLSDEIEIYREDREKLENHIEQLTQDYEDLKHENHDISSKLEQHQLQELKTQNEYSESLATIKELESQAQRLEEKLKKQTQEFSESLFSINELERQVKRLEKELENQAQRFESDLEAMTHAKIEQEQRAIHAEEALRKTRWKNAITAERLQEEFRRLSVEMAGKFDENEKLTTKALTEANELREQNRILEESLQKANEELISIMDQNKVKAKELSTQLDLQTKQMEQMSLELEDKSKQLSHARKYGEEKQETFSMEIQMLKAKTGMLTKEKNGISEQVEHEVKLRDESEQTMTSLEETKRLIERWNRERDELERKFMLAKKEAEKTQEELHLLRSLQDEKETMIGNLLSEVESLRAQYTGLKYSLSKEELEKENLQEQVIKLKDELNKEKEAIAIIEKKLKNDVRQATFLDEKSLTPTDGKMQEFIFTKTMTTNVREFEERENMGENFLHSERSMTESKPVEKEVSMALERNVRIGSEQELKVSTFHSRDDCNFSELLTEMALLEERNKSMESELKEMEERYSEISLKFAEVEGERQQLVMTVRNLKNGKKN